ncbi:proline-rich transmembrane protein 1-like isoform X3 [Saccostrea echinata]|uniref:proline-rich transmembrane protein 1-like isoform X2 n=1 Tax=Saccostrea echinata TaxID=191078 RepID=UPI002A81E72E|nr:proline-rich transmembrane protein 1-like isoform X2 [Saccostrea echinata]XP_061196965.1 proline-rich transmembrane protein 1-like isoform X3 [Saccostrea echinata]
MSSGQKYEMDPKNAGYVQNEQPQNPYNAGYNQPPAYGQQQPAGYGFPMTTNSSTNVVVTNAPAPIVVAAPRGNDWLVPAILSCFFCFWPTGICAIVAAVNARARFDVGDYEGGRSSASWAKGLTLTSLGVGILSVIIIIILYVVVLKEAENELHGFTTQKPWNWN